MIIVKLAALALGLAVAITASPSFGQRGNRTSGTRAQAIHDCSIAAEKYPEYLWGVWDIQVYRACMAKRGQQE
jgi:hypothetical protein